MDALLNRALEGVQSLPDAAQNEIVRARCVSAAKVELAEDIAPEHIDAVLEGLRQAWEGCFATPAEIEAVFARSRV